MLGTFLLTAFGAGFLASLSPCVYPMLPITLGFLTKQSADNTITELQKKLRVFGFFLGQVASFTLLGVVAVQLGEIFGFSSQSPWVHLALAIMLLIMAWASYSEKAQHFFSKLNGIVQSRGSGRSGSSRTEVKILSGFFIGALSALVASPCTSPILGGVLGQISNQGDLVSGILQMMAFATGMSFIFLLLGLGLIRSQNLPKAGKWMKHIHALTTVILVFASGYYFWNFYLSMTSSI